MLNHPVTKLPRVPFWKASAWLLALGVCASPEWSCLAGDSPKKTTIEQVPAAARKTIREEAGNAAIGEIQPEEEDGRNVFTVTLTEAGHDRQLTVAADGTLLSKDVPLEDAPPPVRNTVQGQLKGGKLESIAKTFDENEIYYEATITRKDGSERSLTVGLDGKLLSVDMSLDEIPGAVRKTIETSLGTGKLENISHMFEDGENSYYVEFSQDGKERDLSVAEDGKLQSMEVFLPDLAAAVQKTINDKIGSGTIVRIDKSFEARDGVFPYEIEGRKDGKPFNFSVSARGKFLGMDE